MDLIRRQDRSHITEEPAVEATPAPEPAADRPSVFDQFEQVMANGGLPKDDAPAPVRVSRREQLQQVAEQPFVQRAMELFDVAADRIRYSPPESESK